MNNPAVKTAILLSSIFYALAANAAPVTADIENVGKLTIDGDICTIDSDRTKIVVNPTGVHMDDMDDGAWEVKNNVSIQKSGPKPTQKTAEAVNIVAGQAIDLCRRYSDKLIGPEI